MDKAPDAFRTISEVADYLETPAHVLRFWETRFPQVKPVKGAGGRRYYRPSDVALLSGIRRLLHTDGMTIRGVQKILRDQGVRHVAELGGEVLEAPEPLEALLPPAKPPGEVVPLRPAPLPDPEPAELPPLDDVLSAIRDDLAPPDEALDLGDPADLTDAALLDPAEDLTDAALLDESLPEQEASDLSAPKPSAFGSFGGFGLDLDVPRDGEGGFIAFSNGTEPARPAAPQGFVAPEARPKRPAPAQPTLFDLAPPEESGQHLLEEVSDEAPHIFVDEDFGAEVTAFPGTEPGEDDLPEDLPPDAPEEDPATPDEVPAPAPLEDAPFEEGPDPASPQEDPFEDIPEEDHAEAPSLADTGDQAADSAPAVAELAGIAARLRPLSVTDADRIFALADLQARLGLLQAQMAEAATRPRRAPGH